MTRPCPFMGAPTSSKACGWPTAAPIDFAVAKSAHRYEGAKSLQTIPKTSEALSAFKEPIPTCLNQDGLLSFEYTTDQHYGGN